MRRQYITFTTTFTPRGLEVRPRETGKSAKAYPSLPTTLEETVGTGSNRTVTWLQDTKPTTDKKANEGARAEITQIMMHLNSLPITVS